MSEFEAAFTSEFLAARVNQDPPICSEDMFCECEACTEEMDRREA